MSTTVCETVPASWILHFIKDDKNKTDAKNSIDKIPEKMSQCAAVKAYESRGAVPPAFAQNKVFTPMASATVGSCAGVPIISGTISESGGGTAQAVTTTGRTAQRKYDILLEFLVKLREPIVNFEEQRGVPRDMKYSFVGLVTSLAHQSYNALLTIMTMLVNLMPLAEGFIQIFRFVLDKAIDICRTQEKTDRALKLVILCGEIAVMGAIVTLIFGIIFAPVLQFLYFAASRALGIILPH